VTSDICSVSVTFEVNLAFHSITYYLYNLPARPVEMCNVLWSVILLVSTPCAVSIGLLFSSFIGQYGDCMDGGTRYADITRMAAWVAGGLVVAVESATFALCVEE